MKMRGNPTPEPSYSPDVAGLLRWLRQPHSQWSALGWQNAPAWADAIGDLVAFLEKERDKAIADRDEYLGGRRQTLRALDEANDIAARYKFERNEARLELCKWIATTRGLCTPSAVAAHRGWDCYRKNDEGKVTR